MLFSFSFSTRCIAVLAAFLAPFFLLNGINSSEESDDGDEELVDVDVNEDDDDEDDVLSGDSDLSLLYLRLLLLF